MFFKRIAFKEFFLLCLALSCFSATYADQELISLFPLDNYNQDISNWIDPTSSGYDTPLLNSDMQQKHMDKYYSRHFGEKSPWSEAYVKKILLPSPPDDVKTIEQSIITLYSNQGKSADQIGYGENFRPHSKDWLNTIRDNIDLSQLDRLIYQPHNRAIAVDNLQARALPTKDVHFYSHKLAGQGYPFDNLQMSAVWAGTPLYVISKTQDHAWSLVITPEYIAWVKTKGIAYVSHGFVDTWQKNAKQSLAAITRTQTRLLDNRNNFLLSAYIGSVFPAVETTIGIKLFIPVADDNHYAKIQTSIVPKDQASIMPLPATPHNFANIMHSLIGRPYGWGSMYFYNDCSAELKSLFTPFGIWLPRNSSEQVRAGKIVDMSSASVAQRISYLMEHGRPFFTLIYTGGHIFLYLGSHPNPNSPDQAPMALTYQNIWGLKPTPAIRRSVIGKAVIFPLLMQYPEDNTLASPAAGKYFQVAYLDQEPDYIAKLKLNLMSLMKPAD